ncbi:HAD-IA family hydrolase [Candidatus Woesearchaeota archaeon]|nr:HAD-IA family hydrolase [Candidatus Woesearchaeota archaeon]
MSYKAILFDLDGTLLHSAPTLRYELVMRTLDDLGASAPDHYIDRRYIDQWWFECDRTRIIKEHFRVDPEAFWKALQRHNTEELNKQHIQTYDDVSVLRELREQGYNTGVVTGTPRHLAQCKIGLLGEELFDVIIVCDSINQVKPKPDPDGLQKAMFLLGVQPGATIYVGNAYEDVLAAKNAGVLDVLINRKEYRFPHARPTATIDSLYELRHLL